MRENNSFYDIYFISHPADLDHVGRIAAQMRATAVEVSFDEGEFGKTAEGIKGLKALILRSYTVAFVMSPDSAESQLCNELLQYAVSKGKGLVTVILDDDIEVEVHPSIAQNPYVFFREDDDLAARVDELRAYLSADAHLRLHTELLALAETWRERGRPPDLLLPPARLDDARDWLATAPARHPKPSALQLEYVHSSRRQPPRRGRARARRFALGLVALMSLGALLLLLQRTIVGWQAGQVAGALTNEARAQVAAAATAAGDSAFGLIDQVAATSALVRTGVAQHATQESITATAAARVAQTAVALEDLRATQVRASEISDLELDDVARGLVQAGEAALERGDIELALALAWEAKDGLNNPGAAHRLLRRAVSGGRAMTIDDVALLRLHPAGLAFALVPASRDVLQIYDGNTWSRLYERTDHEDDITTLIYSGDGARLISASSDGEIIIRDGLTGAAKRRLNRQGGAVSALALAADGGTLFSAASDPLLVAWDIGSGEELAVYTGGDESDLESQDLIVTAGGERVIGWMETQSQTVMAQWAADTLEMLSADSGGRVYRGVDAQGRTGYSGGSSLPAYPGDTNTGDLIFWDLSTGEQRARVTDGYNWSFLSGDSLAAATDDLRLVAFYEDLALVVVDNSETGQRANLVDVEDGRQLRSFDGAIAAGITSAIFLDGETILSTTNDDRVLLWSSGDGRLIREIGRAPHRIDALRGNVAANTVIAHTEDGASHFFPFTTAVAEPTLTLKDGLPGTTISPSGDVIFLVEEEGLSLLEVESGATLVQLPADLVDVAGARFGIYADGRLSIHDLETGAEVRGWDWAGGSLFDLSLSPDGEQLLAYSAADELWLARADAAAPQRLAGDMARPALIRFAPVGNAILTLQGEFAVLWDGEVGLARAAYPLGAGERADVQAAFSADGASVIFYVQLENGLASLTVLEVAEGDLRRQTYVDVESAALSSAGEHLSLAYGDGRIQIVSTASGAIIHEVDANGINIQKLEFLPDSSALLAAAGTELILWDAEAGGLGQRLAHPYAIVDFSISRTAERILTVDEHGVYRLWPVESAEELLARIEAYHQPRALTCAEREQYLVAPLCQ